MDIHFYLFFPPFPSIYLRSHFSFLIVSYKMFLRLIDLSLLSKTFYQGRVRYFSWRPRYFIRHCTSCIHVTIHPSRRRNASRGIIHNGRRRNRLYHSPYFTVIRTRRLSFRAFSQVIIFLCARTYAARSYCDFYESQHISWRVSGNLGGGLYVYKPLLFVRRRFYWNI